MWQERGQIRLQALRMMTMTKRWSMCVSIPYIELLYAFARRQFYLSNVTDPYNQPDDSSGSDDDVVIVGE